ncbi:hypothetical protein H8356DRAFT_1363292 [Neocallimastix lanati (nom. inval.)]|nr:hypothetical protein H8356DRAFT_1363292 [Neocallimastix sp. JGI-2020a]
MKISYIFQVNNKSNNENLNNNHEYDGLNININNLEIINNNQYNSNEINHYINNSITNNIAYLNAHLDEEIYVMIPQDIYMDKCNSDLNGTEQYQNFN